MTIAEDNKGQRHGLAMTISVVLHGLLVLFLLFYTFITPIPPDFDVQEGAGGGSGVELALGMDLMGMGDGTGNSAPSQEESAPPPTPVEESTPLTSDVEEDTPPVTTTDNKDKPKPPKEKPKPRELTEEEKAKAAKDKFDNMWNTKGNGQEGHGTTNTPGGEGVPGGKPGGTGIGTGTGSYIGPGHRADVPGYTVRSKPEIKDKPSAGGRVVMDIWVAPDGKVTRASQNTSKSTTLDQTLVAIAKRTCLAYSFFPNPKATGEQRGSITFTFELE